MNSLWVIPGLAIFTAAVIGSLNGIDRLLRDNPDELAAKWTVKRSLETGYKNAAWLTVNHPDTADLDTQWLAAELISATRWDISEVEHLREDVYQATATAVAEISLPEHPDRAIRAEIPWDLRIYQRNQGITANSARKSGRFHHSVVATLLWKSATVESIAHTPPPLNISHKSLQPALAGIDHWSAGPPQ